MDELDAGGSTEGRESDPDAAVGIIPGGNLHQSRCRGFRIRAADEANEERHIPHEWQQVFQQKHRRVIGPVDILENENERALLSQAGEKASDGAKDLAPHGLPVQKLDALRQVTRNIQRQQGGQIRKNLGTLLMK